MRTHKLRRITDRIRAGERQLNSIADQIAEMGVGMHVLELREKAGELRALAISFERYADDSRDPRGKHRTEQP